MKKGMQYSVSREEWRRKSAQKEFLIISLSTTRRGEEGGEKHAFLALGEGPSSPDKKREKRE